MTLGQACPQRSTHVREESINIVLSGILVCWSYTAWCVGKTTWNNISIPALWKVIIKERMSATTQWTKKMKAARRGPGKKHNSKYALKCVLGCCDTNQAGRSASRRSRCHSTSSEYVLQQWNRRQRLSSSRSFGACRVPDGSGACRHRRWCRRDCGTGRSCGFCPRKPRGGLRDAYLGPGVDWIVGVALPTLPKESHKMSWIVEAILQHRAGIQNFF